MGFAIAGCVSMKQTSHVCFYVALAISPEVLQWLCLHCLHYTLTYCHAFYQYLTCEPWAWRDWRRLMLIHWVWNKNDDHGIRAPDWNWDWQVDAQYACNEDMQCILIDLQYWQHSLIVCLHEMQYCIVGCSSWNSKLNFCLKNHSARLVFFLFPGFLDSTVK